MFIYISINDPFVHVQVSNISQWQYLYEDKYCCRKLPVVMVAKQPYPHNVPLFTHYSTPMKMGSYWLKHVRDSQKVSRSEHAFTIKAVSEKVINYVRYSQLVPLTR